MIIKGGAVSCKSGTSKTASHIFEGPTNEQIEALQGNPEDMKDMLNDARQQGLKYAFEHFKISPEKEITRAEAYKDFQAIADEYGFSLSDSVIVEHRKARQNDENSPIHWHMIAPYLNPETGKAVDLKNNFARNEKLSRLSEIRTGQTLIKGQHNEAVFYTLQKEGKISEANQVKHLMEGDLPLPSYSQDSHQKAGRRGINLPEEKNNIKEIYKLCDGIKSFKSALEEKGYSIKEGNKKDTYIIEKDGLLIGSANRLLSMKKEIFKEEFKNATTTRKKLRFGSDKQEANNSASDIQPSQEISTQHIPDNRTSDRAAGRRITDSANPGTTPGHSKSAKSTAQNIRANSKNTSYAVAKARINSSAGVASVKVESDDKTASAAGIRAGNAVIEEWKNLERLNEEIDEFFQNLEKMNKLNKISKERFLKKSALKNVNSSLKEKYDVLKNRPKVRSWKDIKYDLENKPFQDYLKSKKEKEQCEEKIKILEKKKYGMFKSFNKEYKKYIKTLEELKELLTELCSKENNLSDKYDIKLRISYDEAKSEQDKQKRDQEDYDKKHDIEKTRDDFAKLKNIKEDILNNDKDIIEDVHKNGPENELKKRQEEEQKQLEELHEKQKKEAEKTAKLSQARTNAMLKKMDGSKKSQEELEAEELNTLGFKP
ncbi:hypothetical protein [Acetobacter thailandicus]|uniref:MobA/MobL protein domain-containing protein n=1 Tax=Acetobacter thailandicus TaxID=1502842 RepID=A0ABT3QEI1_9PROT|nr:hypothetical protein [Acetobacter thailandicus]MCX2563697.1 hypothetical protein [Acetobacter thailandicus]NHN95231.1 hypothetical protein [Acetobacter thailandicus]